MAGHVQGFNKTKFVQSQPLSMTAGEVVKAARRLHGVKISNVLVYSVRGQMKKPDAVATEAPTALEKKPAKDGGLTKEQQLRKLVIQMGVMSARKVVDSVETLTWS